MRPLRNSTDPGMNNHSGLATRGRLGVVDIGSNTVRLVVYDTPNRLPIPIFNEKANCGLGRGLQASGVLNPQGREEALRSLARFVGLADSMGVERLEMVATAAVRDADDGDEFVEEVRNQFGFTVEVLSGDDEAMFAARGLLMGTPDADGIVADIGGGSVDIVELIKGKFGQTATLPLGHLRLPEASDYDTDTAKMIIDKAFGDLPWLSNGKGRPLYAIGGSWRAMARVFIDQTAYPLHVIDGYTLRRNRARELGKLITKLGKGTIESIPDIPKDRTRTLPFAAMVMARLLKSTKVSKVVFSGFGMREGKLLTMLPAQLSGQDPLLSGCAGMAERTGRFAITGQEIFHWIAPLCPPGRDAESRLRMAACMLSDIGWSEHPDYRAEHAFLRVLRLPFAGLTHAERVFLAVAIFVRYNGDPDNSLVRAVSALMTDYDIDHANTTGLALRLAHTISGSAPGILARTWFEVGADELVLRMPKDGSVGGGMFASEAIERRLATLGRALGLRGRLG